MKHDTGNPVCDSTKPAMGGKTLSGLWHKAAEKERFKKAERDLVLLPTEEKAKRRCPEKSATGCKDHQAMRLKERMDYERMVAPPTATAQPSRQHTQCSRNSRD
jgi:hypothetical protein